MLFWVEYSVYSSALLLKFQDTEPRCQPSVLQSTLLISRPARFHFVAVIDAAEVFQLLHLFSHLTLCPHFNKKSHRTAKFSNFACASFFFLFTSPCKCLCLHNDVSQHASVQLCDFFLCLCLALTSETAAAAAYWVSDWSPVARSGELCELWCSLTAAFSWKASLWGPAGFQYAHLHIKTAQERDSAQGWVGVGGEGLQKEGGQGNEGCFIFSFFSPPQGWAGV